MRILARALARELTPLEIDSVLGGAAPGDKWTDTETGKIWTETGNCPAGWCEMERDDSSSLNGVAASIDPQFERD